MNKPTIKMTTSARVTVQFDINIGNTWGPGCTLEQVMKQASFDLPRMTVKVIKIDAISTRTDVRNDDA